MEKWQIIDDIEEIQEKVNEMGFTGSNEKELWTRDLIADYIVKKLTIPVVGKSFYCMASNGYDGFTKDNCKEQCDMCKSGQ